MARVLGLWSPKVMYILQKGIVRFIGWINPLCGVGLFKWVLPVGVGCFESSVLYLPGGFGSV